MEPSAQPSIKWVDGFPVPGYLPESHYRAALTYQPRDGDIFIATYPKCGTTWAQHIVLLLLRGGEPLTSTLEFMMTSPYMELMGPQVMENMARPGAIKTHLPYHLIPKSTRAKYINIYRNPKDCCVSYYHHVMGIKLHEFGGTFDQFFEHSMSGEVAYGDYFDHLLGWYAHRNDPNVLFLTYEQMKENPKDVIMKIASFMDDKQYAEPLRADPDRLRKVVQFSSFKHLKESINTGLVEEMVHLFQGGDTSELGLPAELLEVLSQFQKPFSSDSNSTDSAPVPALNFIRKGIIGDWRNYFTPDHSRRMDEKFEERTRDTDIPDLWRKYM